MGTGPIGFETQKYSKVVYCFQIFNYFGLWHFFVLYLICTFLLGTSLYQFSITFILLDLFIFEE